MPACETWVPSPRAEGRVSAPGQLCYQRRREPVLSFGTPPAVCEDTREHSERPGGEGGCLVCFSQSILDTVSPENYLAMVEAARELGSCAGQGAGPCS